MRRPPLSAQSLRRGLLLAGVGLLAAPGLAMAGCVENVVTQAIGQARVTGHHPQSCYAEALRSLPADASYTEAESAIRLAMSRDRALGAGPSTRTTATGATTGTTAVSSGGRSGTGTPPSTGGPGGPPAVQPNVDTPDPSRRLTGVSRLLDGGATTHPTRVPTPVIVLGVLVGLVLLGGAAAWLVRRRTRADPLP